MKARQTVLLDPATIAPVGSMPWAEALRQRLQDATDRAVGGRIDFGMDLIEFWQVKGWTVLTDGAGDPFKTFRDFALALRPHGLQLPLPLYLAMMKDLDKGEVEAAEYAEVHKAMTPQEAGKLGGKGKKAASHRRSFGTTADYLARRIARDHPDVLARMKAGEFSSVRQAGKAAGIVKEPSVVHELRRLWTKATPEDRAAFRVWIDEEGARGGHQ